MGDIIKDALKHMQSCDSAGIEALLSVIGTTSTGWNHDKYNATKDFNFVSAQITINNLIEKIYQYF